MLFLYGLNVPFFRSIGLNIDDLEAEEEVQPISYVLTVTRFDRLLDSVFASRR